MTSISFRFLDRARGVVRCGVMTTLVLPYRLFVSAGFAARRKTGVWFMWELDYGVESACLPPAVPPRAFVYSISEKWRQREGAF